MISQVGSMASATAKRCLAMGKGSVVYDPYQGPPRRSRPPDERPSPISTPRSAGPISSASIARTRQETVRLVNSARLKLMKPTAI